MTFRFTTTASDDQGASASRSPKRLIAWVDGVGTFLICLDETTTIGGMAGGSDVRLTADLASRHASIHRSGEGYVVEATGPALVASGAATTSGRHGLGRVVQERTNVNNGDEVVLYREEGRGVRLRFRQPNALTATAAIAVESDHRTDPRYDGIVLLAEACVLGPRPDAHIRCRDWDETILLFRRDGGLWCKSPVPLTVGGRLADGPIPVAAGDHVSGSGISFRMEAIETRRAGDAAR